MNTDERKSDTSENAAMSQATTMVHGQGGRCSKWRMHRNLRWSDSATCFHCDHFHQPMEEDGETPWSLEFDDKGTCVIGMVNADE